MTGFDQGDIVVLGADLSSFDAVSDTVYKVSVAPRDLIVTLNVAAAAAKDLEGNDNLAAEEARSVARPELTISGVLLVRGSNAAFVATFTFNKSVTGLI